MLRHYQQFSIITQPRTNGRYSIADIKRRFVKGCHQKHSSFEDGVSSWSLSVSGACRIHCAALKWLEVSPFCETATDTIIKGTFRRTCEKIHSFAVRFIIGLPSVKLHFHSRYSWRAFVTSHFVRTMQLYDQWPIVLFVRTVGQKNHPYI